MVKQLNIAIYGRWEKTRDNLGGTWTFSGIDGVEKARNINEALAVMNLAGYEVVAATESGGPHDERAWSNVYIYGRRAQLVA